MCNGEVDRFRGAVCNGYLENQQKSFNFCGYQGEGDARNLKACRKIRSFSPKSSRIHHRSTACKKKVSDKTNSF